MSSQEFCHGCLKYVSEPERVGGPGEPYTYHLGCALDALSEAESEFAIASAGLRLSRTAELVREIDWLKKHTTIPLTAEEIATDILADEGYGICDDGGCKSIFALADSWTHCTEEGTCWAHCTDRYGHAGGWEPDYEDHDWDDEREEDEIARDPKRAQERGL